MIEQQSINKIPKSRVKAVLRVPGEFTESEYRKISEKYSKEIRLDGFRKGKAPKSLLEKKYGKVFRGEVLKKLFEEVSGEVLPGLEFPPLPYSQPEIASIEDSADSNDGRAEEEVMERFCPGEDLDFAVVYDVFPEVPEIPVTGLSVEPAQGTVSDEDIQAELESLREQNALMIEKKTEPAAEGDLISLEFGFLPEGSDEVPAGDRASAIIRFGESDEYGFQPYLEGIRVGDQKIVERHTFPDGPGLEERFAGSEGRLWLKVSGIRSRSLPDLDDDFVQDIDDKYETLEDLKQAFRDRLSEESRELEESYLLLQIYRHLAERLDFEIPRSMIAYHFKMTLDNLRQRMGGTERGLLLYLTMQYGENPEKGLREIEKKSVWHLFVDLIRQKSLQGRDWTAGEAEIEEELARLASRRGLSVEAFSEEEKDRWEEWKKQAGQMVLEKRLSAELLGLAEKTEPETVSLEELRKKHADLEQLCCDAVYEKFSVMEEQER